MLSTGIFTTHSYSMAVDKSNEPIYILPFGDVHKFAPLHSKHHWDLFLETAQTIGRAYFLGMGDYMDLASASERNILRDRKLHDSTIMTLEELYMDHIQRFFKEIEFMKGKVIGLVEGNHYAEFQDGTTSTQRLCNLLGCKYLGVSTFIRLSFNYKDCKRASVDVWAHHGKGAARLIGGSLNRVQQMGELAEADIYIMGHDHKRSAGMTSKLRLQAGGGGLKVVHKKQLYLRSGSFLRGYVEEMPSYVADGAMNPTDLGSVVITVLPVKGDLYSLDIKATI